MVPRSSQDLLSKKGDMPQHFLHQKTALIFEEWNYYILWILSGNNLASLLLPKYWPKYHGRFQVWPEYHGRFQVSNWSSCFMGVGGGRGGWDWQWWLSGGRVAGSTEVGLYMSIYETAEVLSPPVVDAALLLQQLLSCYIQHWSVLLIHKLDWLKESVA